MNTRTCARPAADPRSALTTTRWWPGRWPNWAWALVLVALAAALPVWAQAASGEDDDPPGRVGRLAQVDGEVQWYDSANGTWESAERNRPLTGGDRLSTGPGSRAELRVGSTVLRLAAATELEVRVLDDERMVFALHSGSLALRVRSRELAREIELRTIEARLAPLRAGHYRLDRIDDSTQAGSWRGELRVLGAGGFDISSGEHVELWREGPGDADNRRLAHTRTPLPQDDFATWVLRADQRDTRSVSAQHVSPEMTGVEELDRHGRWDRHPDHGAIWFPRVVAADWAPYRHGRWLWTARWGWTWVDAAPWGFAPFHYGRWLHYGGRWAWAPGAYVHRPVFAPALVAWVGGPDFGISVNIGGSMRPGHPHLGWVPLAPHEVYRPWYRASPGHVHRIDRHHPPHERPAPRVRPGEPGRPTIPERVQPRPQQWANQRAPGGVTVATRDALTRHDPQQRVVVQGPEAPSRPWPAREALPAQAPPAPVFAPARERERERGPDREPDREREPEGQRPQRPPQVQPPPPLPPPPRPTVPVRPATQAPTPPPIRAPLPQQAPAAAPAPRAAPQAEAPRAGVPSRERGQREEQARD